MSSIYLEGRIKRESECTLESLITLCVYKYCSISDVSIIFVQCENKNNIPIKLNDINYSLKEIDECPWQVRSCTLPVFISQNNVVTGLCGVVRHLIRYRTTNPYAEEHPEGLLGFRSSCLQAPNEVSVWTKFCEIEIINTTKSLLTHDFQSVFYLPSNIIRFEKHLNQPSRIHNVCKIARDIKKQSNNQKEDGIFSDTLSEHTESVPLCKGRNTVKQRKWKNTCDQKNSGKLESLEDTTELLKSLEHSFAEGPFMTLADIILYPCYLLIFHILNYKSLECVLPKSINWFKQINQCKYFDTINRILSIGSTMNKCKVDMKYMVPEIEDVSLYKCDPKRHNPKKKAFTKENNVEESLNYIKSSMLLNIAENTFIKQDKIIWTDIPSEANPNGGHLPDKRKERKTQQLENLVNCVMNLAQSDDTIVDFCCGSGHLGILLAYLLPKCTIILLENKEESLNRANLRINNLGLKNIYLFQCNIDYFVGAFNIGVALHACGVATDLVLEKCIAKRASFVVCPCCYGSLHLTERLLYPRSDVFSSVPTDKYLCISHTADQTHVNHPLEAQGIQCMAIIDSDRGHNALENGYSVNLTRMIPLCCTPKNMLLVGKPSGPNPTHQC